MVFELAGLWLALALALTLALAPVHAQPSVSASLHTVRSYEVFEGGKDTSTQPPPAQSRGTPSDGVLREGRNAAGQSRWLRARVDLEQVPASALALYIAAASRAQVYINGVEVGNASLSNAQRFGWNHPLFYSLPATLLREGDNTIDLRVQLNRFGDGAARGMQLGPQSELHEHYDRVFFWRVTGPQITSLVLLLMGFPALLVWWRLRSETIYGWFGAACVLAALRNGHLFVVAPELSRWYEAWAAVPLHWMLVSLMMFSFRLCRRRFVRLERAVLIITVVWTLVLLTSPVTWPFNLGYVWLTVLWLGTIAFVALQYRRTPRLELLLLVLALAVAQALGGLDMLMQLGLRQSDSRIYLTPYSLLVFALVMGANLVDTFSRARATQERLNQELDRRLAARELEIAIEHGRVLQLQREQAAATERERIMRELHDGLGANLITSMQAAETGTLQGPELAAMLRDCVDDLRLALDSLRPTGNELLPVLGNLRYRMQPRLASAGVQLDWGLSPEATSPLLSPDQVLHTLRIVQEAIANALKHASPKSIGVRYETLAHGGWRLTVLDDGCGIDTAYTDGTGNGLRNMHKRAALIPARLRLLRMERGTAVELSVGAATPPAAPTLSAAD